MSSVDHVQLDHVIMWKLHFLGILFSLIYSNLDCCHAVYTGYTHVHQQYDINIDQLGLKFDGIGAISGGGVSDITGSVK